MTNHKNVVCKNCNSKHFEQALHCPNCGITNPAYKKPKATLGETITGVVIVIGIGWAIIAMLFGEDEPVVLSIEEQVRAARIEAEYKATGFHCLSTFDGSHREVVSTVKGQLRDPSSFDHTETRITPVNASGEHELFMEYRARNGFGGITVGMARATINNSSCQARLLAVE